MEIFEWGDWLYILYIFNICLFNANFLFSFELSKFPNKNNHIKLIFSCKDKKY